MRCTNVLVAATIALSAANAATAQQFDLRMRFAAPGGLKAKDSGIVFDVDQSGGVDVLLKGGSVLMADGNLGFTWSPPGGRRPRRAAQLGPGHRRRRSGGRGDGDWPGWSRGGHAPGVDGA